MNEWLANTLAAISDETFVLSDEDATTLLAIARIASHDSSDRTNAPLLCYLIGRLAERSPAANLEQIQEVIAGRARSDS